MKDPKDLVGLKAARSVLSRRGIDTTKADVRVMHGVLIIRGQVTAVRGSTVKDVRAEMENISKVLRQKPEIRDVVLDCVYPGI